ncbi:unnamed protein product [Clonostachys chloroleuca]|uniref:Flavin reductase like domain-containing protein n=1 Tax=Clonostachys chloroleuca TaxID=1926264 RepID=A0AA35LX18_9HYPO|nr:unnamed protein product [Clonostachys chloroleuca]
MCRIFKVAQELSSTVYSNKLPTPTAAVSASDPLPEQLRSIMRLLTHPVVVCTAHDGSHPRGMTMSSFTSLTLTPTPLITFNVLAPSRTLDAITESGEFNIHILAGDRNGAAVAENFTRGNTDPSVFQSLQSAASKQGTGSLAPVLVGDGILYVLRCRLAGDAAPNGGLIRVRDHIVVVAEVVGTVPGIEDKEFGLSYSDRSFRGAGEVIARH